jgi:hypothetical protein
MGPALLLSGRVAREIREHGSRLAVKRRTFGSALGSSECPVVGADGPPPW